MRRRYAALAGVVFLAAVLTAGCGQTYDLDQVRARSDEMSARILEALFDTDAYGAESNIAAIVSEFSDLADPLLARFVERRRDAETDPRLRKQLSYLFFDIVGTLMWEPLAEAEDEIMNIEAAGVVTVGPEEIPYREIGIRLYNETDSELRQKLYLAMGQFDVENTNPLRENMVARVREGVREYGFEDLGEFEQARRALDFDTFESTVVEFIDSTDDIYAELTDDAAHDVFGVAIADVRDYDRGRLFRGAEYDDYFPAEGMMSLLKETCLDMGIDLDSISCITIDDEDRPEKEPRAGTYTVRPGEDIRVLVKPSGGVSDYESLFHEMGHALHDAFTSVPEYEFQRLGDYGTTETYAFLMESLFEDEAYLESKSLIEDEAVRSAFLKKQLLSELGSARYYAGLFRYERILHEGELAEEDLIAAYGDLMEDSRLVPLEHPEFGYLSSNEDFYGVNYLEAWFLTAQLRATLTERFGEDWWASEEAGKFLTELWSLGSEFSPNEIARRLGYEGLDSSYLITEIENAYEAYD